MYMTIIYKSYRVKVYLGWCVHLGPNFYEIEAGKKDFLRRIKF